jgi:hypothetical protein
MGQHSNKGTAIILEMKYRNVNGMNAYNAILSLYSSRITFDTAKKGVEMLVRVNPCNANSCMPTW